MRSGHPLVQGNVGPLEDGAHGCGELLLARVAVVKAGAVLALNGAGFIRRTTMRAVAAIGPTKGLEMLPSLCFIVENRVREVGHWGVLSAKLLSLNYSPASLPSSI